jgi:hypothetical protein
MKKRRIRGTDGYLNRCLCASPPPSLDDKKILCREPLPSPSPAPLLLLLLLANYHLPS